MKRVLKLATLVLSIAGVSCWADMIQDPLHGYCAGAGQCIDNGTNSPTTLNAPINFGFTISPGPATGSLMIDLLAPNKEPHAASYALTGTLAGTATLFSATAWTSGALDAYLGISASPTNPIGAFLPSTQALDPGATGFFVYQVSFPSVTLQDASNPDVSPLENISPGIPLASYLVGFLNEGGGTIVATANSGAIFETKGFTPPVPEPSSIILLGSVIVGLVTLLKERCTAALLRTFDFSADTDGGGVGQLRPGVRFA